MRREVSLALLPTVEFLLKLCAPLERRCVELLDQIGRVLKLRGDVSQLAVSRLQPPLRYLFIPKCFKPLRERGLGLVRGLLGLIGVLGLILLCLVLRLIGIIYKIVLDFFMIFINFIPLIGILGFRFGREYMDIIDFRIVWS